MRDTSGNAVVPYVGIVDLSSPANRTRSEAELPFLIAHLSLYTDNGQSRLDVGWQSGQGPPILYGNLVSSLDVLEDLQGNMGLFFIFPDVSIRWQGRFQLGISLLRISRQVDFVLFWEVIYSLIVAHVAQTLKGALAWQIPAQFLRRRAQDLSKSYLRTSTKQSVSGLIASSRFRALMTS